MALLIYTDSYITPAYLEKHDINIAYQAPANAPLPGWKDMVQPGPSLGVAIVECMDWLGLFTSES